MDRDVFHRLAGPDVIVTSDGSATAATLREGRRCYVFTSGPLYAGDAFSIELLLVDESEDDGFAFGLTSCDPEQLTPAELPVDPDLLLDRPEYWVVVKGVLRGRRSCASGDVLTFLRSDDGEIRLHKNGEYIASLMFVDRTLPMWALVNLQGKLMAVRPFACQGARLETDNSNKISSSSSSVNVVTNQLSPVTSTPSNVQQDDQTASLDIRFLRQQLNITDPPPTAPSVLRDNPQHPSVTPLPVPRTETGNTTVPSQSTAYGTAPVGGGTSSTSNATKFLFRASSASSPVGTPSPSAADKSVRRRSSALMDKHPWPPPPTADVDEQPRSDERRGQPKISDVTTPRPPPRATTNVVRPSPDPRSGSNESDQRTVRPSAVSQRDPGVRPTPSLRQKSIELTRQQTSPVSPPSTTTSTVAPEQRRTTPASDECCSCLDRPKDCVLYRCGHVCLCFDCADDIRRRQNPPLCPVCRQLIDDVIKIFVA